jgi:hypothetical protein
MWWVGGLQGGPTPIKQPKKGEGPQRKCSAVYHLDKLQLA